jgi:5-methylcytosine-specific restriction endonuclease McrA
MKKIRARTPRFSLDSESYRKLHRQVLERDHWRCQMCGDMQHLQVHHQQHRSHSGSDGEQNLITLCAGCHAQLHRGTSE